MGMEASLVDLARNYRDARGKAGDSRRSATGDRRLTLRVDHAAFAAFLRKLHPFNTAANVSADCGGRVSIRTVEAWLGATPPAPSLDRFAVLALVYGPAVIAAAIPELDFIKPILQRQLIGDLGAAREALDRALDDARSTEGVEFRLSVLPPRRHHQSTKSGEGRADERTVARASRPGESISFRRAQQGS